MFKQKNSIINFSSKIFLLLLLGQLVLADIKDISKRLKKIKSNKFTYLTKFHFGIEGRVAYETRITTPEAESGPEDLEFKFELSLFEFDSWDETKAKKTNFCRDIKPNAIYSHLVTARWDSDTTLQ